jgi:Holliday junction DNA helicase RuvA
MIDYIEGFLARHTADSIIIEIGGIGVEIHTSSATLAEVVAQPGTIRLFTTLVLRENDASLYGFSTQSERELFALLRSVSGIGPKVAIGILSSMRPDKFQEAILSESVVSFSDVKGVGKKTAERLIVELKDKVSKLSIDVSSSPALQSHDDTALRALKNLGFGEREVQRAIEEAKRENDDLTTEEIVKRALNYLSGVS